jgi:spore germination protein GerM
MKEPNTFKRALNADPKQASRKKANLTKKVAVNSRSRAAKPVKQNAGVQKKGALIRKNVSKGENVPFGGKKFISSSLAFFSLLTILLVSFFFFGSKFSGIKKIEKIDSAKAGGNGLYLHRPNLYFFKFDSQNDRVARQKVFRKTLQNAHIREVFDELLRGPLEKEKQKGLVTALSTNLKLIGFKYNPASKIVTLNFNEALEENGSREIIQKRIEQLVYTGTQFSAIQGISIRIRGKGKAVISGDGIILPEVLTRRNLQFL